MYGKLLLKNVVPEHSWPQPSCGVGSLVFFLLKHTLNEEVRYHQSPGHQSHQGKPVTKGHGYGKSKLQE